MSEHKPGQWADFVRGVADPETADHMRKDLESGSESARRTVEALRRVAAVGRSDSDHPVPPDAVRIAKAAFSTPRAGAAPEVRRVPCALIFDSLLAPAAAGARGAQQSHRELTFEAQGYSVDLRLEHEIESPAEGTPPSMVVVGQLLEARGDAPQPVARAPVFMFSGERLIGKAVTGRLGEFQVEGFQNLPSGALGSEASGDSLCILAGEDYLEMPLGAGYEENTP